LAASIAHLVTADDETVEPTFGIYLTQRKFVTERQRCVGAVLLG